MKSLLKSWKTTAAGIAAILTAGGLVFQAVSGETVDGSALGEAFALFMTGLGLLAARDGNKTSQDHGVRRGP
jgi:hypothetical protein